jgi:hypothetical protein
VTKNCQCGRRILSRCRSCIRLIAVETIDGVTTTEQGQAYEDKLSKAKESPVYFKKVGE